LNAPLARANSARVGIGGFMMKRATLLFLLVLAGAAMAEDLNVSSADIAIYGATPGGIAAALAAGKSGCTVVLIEPYSHIGGLTTNGLSHTDYHAFEGLTGTFLAFARRVEAYYVAKYGADSIQVKECMRGTQAEPHVNRLILEQMLAEQKSVTVMTRQTLIAVQVVARGGAQRIQTLTLEGPDGKKSLVEAGCFIDGTYEGDLMAKAGEEYRVGREARSEFDESLAPETSDQQLQAYNFRLSMTPNAENRVPIPKPDGYRREDYADILPLLKANAFKAVFVPNSGKDGFYKAQFPTLPNRKYDINDVSHSPVRLSMPGANNLWPDGDATTRKDIFNTHLRYNLGLLYFVQNDPEVPAKYRDEAREWGLCRDEFADSNYLPEQLYVREARRLRGRYVFSEKDTDCEPGDARAVFKADSIAMGEYGPNCHGTSHEGPRYGGRHVGEFYKVVMPYQIPYGVIVPLKNENLLVPVAVSASHVGFCALRLEPIWMSLGQAAGFAAAISIKEKVAVQDVDVSRLQNRLHADGAATLYVSDVLPGDADFAAVQWWGQQGGLRGLAPLKGPQRGKHIAGQYSETYPGHAVELEAALDAELLSKWNALAATVGLPAAPLAGSKTRGDFIRQAFQHANAK
jgi:hypothetical protein